MEKNNIKQTKLSIKDRLISLKYKSKFKCILGESHVVCLHNLRTLGLKSKFLNYDILIYLLKKLSTFKQKSIFILELVEGVYLSNVVLRNLDPLFRELMFFADKYFEPYQIRVIPQYIEFELETILRKIFENKEDNLKTIVNLNVIGKELPIKYKKWFTNTSNKKRYKNKYFYRIYKKNKKGIFIDSFNKKNQYVTSSLYLDNYLYKNELLLNFYKHVKKIRLFKKRKLRLRYKWRFRKYKYLKGFVKKGMKKSKKKRWKKRLFLRFTTAKLTLKKTNSNWFLILSDLDGKVLGHYSAGFFIYSNRKKEKLDLRVFEWLYTYHILPILVDLNITNLIFIYEGHFNFGLRRLFWAIRSSKRFISGIKWRFRLPHSGGMRKKLPRRL